MSVSDSVATCTTIGAAHDVVEGRGGQHGTIMHQEAAFSALPSGRHPRRIAVCDYSLRVAWYSEHACARWENAGRALDGGLPMFIDTLVAKTADSRGCNNEQ
jgi:hypothetical protein